MDRDRSRPVPHAPARPDRELRELLVYLRDTFHDAAARIDGYLAAHEQAPGAPERSPERPRAAPAPARDAGVHFPLEQLRDEVRRISAEAAGMDPTLLRLHIEAVTAETRSLQARATDPADADIAAKIMRALTAIVADHRPGHVYGLARHHQADWEDVARRARAEIRARSTPSS